MNLLGVDIGGTAVKLGLISPQGEVLRRAERSVSFDGYRTPILQTVLAAARELMDSLGADLRAGIGGIGISAAGQIDTHTGRVAGTCGNLPGWIGVNLKEAFEQAFGRPAWAMNDANCALLGEAWTGRARGYRDVVMVTLGTGVGGGVLAEGRILQGMLGFGGELGHMPLKAGDLPCTCGNAGCYEQYASVTALLRRAGEHWARQGLENPPENAKALFDLAEQGLPEALALLEAWISDIALGLVGLTHLFNPQLILIGGGVSRQGERLIRPLGDKIRALAMPRFGETLEVRAASLGNDAGMIGAARHWMLRHGGPHP